MLRAILNKSWRQHPTSHHLYDHLPPITKTIQVRRTRHAGHCWRSRDELISDVLLWTPHMAVQKQDDQHEHTFSSYVRIRDVVLKTCLGRWTIGRSGEKGSGTSVLPARHDDDDDDSLFKSSSSSSYCVISTDISDHLSPHLPIVHCFRQVLMATCYIIAEGFRLMPLSLVRLRTFRLSTWVSYVQHWGRC